MGNNFGPRFGFAYKIPGAGSTLIRGGAGIFYGPTVSNSIGDFFNPAQVAPTSYQFNLNLQHELTTNLLVELGYVGNVSHHLTSNDLSLNQVAPQLMGAGDAQSRRPFPQFSNVTWINPSIGDSTYHGGFIRAEKRFGGSFSFLAHYTFSKFLDDLESANEYGATGSYMDAYHRDLDKGLSGSDVPHHVVFTLLYESRAFQAHPLLNTAFSGWKLGLLETFMSGPPFTVITTANTTNAFPAGALRPNLLRNPELPSGERTVTHWFDTTAFAAPAQFTFGNSPRSVLRGAALLTTDITVERSFRLTERFKIGTAQRILQPSQSRQFQRARLHVRRCRFRCGDQRQARTNGSARRPPRVLGKSGSDPDFRSPSGRTSNVSTKPTASKAASTSSGVS